ncbi:head scaffolding protein [Lactobacillus phage phiJL-1]|uniref:Scaffold protein n=1 Tax=Lactobacillus phage phiJL-1 TaxID=2892345 RepID=Q597V6_9CAUD|nr:head scaffolding protein [Lactobacillus phage phiJL-1]AAP74515.1 putative scaffold protein [Lactobacillus phage phiJL-1]
MPEDTTSTETTENTEATESESSITLTPKELQAKLDSEADKRSAAAIEKAKAKWEAKQKQAIEDAKNEGAKLAKMSEADKLAEEQKQREEEFKQREAELNKRELSYSTKDLLSEQGLPTDMADSLVALGDADAIKNVVETLKASVDSAVKEQVEKSVQSNPPATGSSVLGDPEDPFSKIMSQYKK